MSSPVEGMWVHKTSRSWVKLFVGVDGTSLHGRYHSGQDPAPSAPVRGVIAVSGTESNFIPISFSASWPQDGDYGPSVTNYTGQYSNVNGVEQIEVVFLLVDMVASTQLWRATRIASEVFHRHSETPPAP